MLLTFDDTISIEQATNTYNTYLKEYLNAKEQYVSALDEYVEEKSQAKPNKRKVREALSEVQKYYSECLSILNDKVVKAKQDVLEVIAKNNANKDNRNPKKDKRKNDQKKRDRTQAEIDAINHIRKLQSDLDDIRTEKESYINNDKYDNENARKLNAKAAYSSNYKRRKELNNELLKYDPSDKEYQDIKNELKTVLDKLNDLQTEYPEYASEFAKEEQVVDKRFKSNLKALDDYNPMTSQYANQIQDLMSEYEDYSKQLARAEIEKDYDLQLKIKNERRQLSYKINELVGKLKRIDPNNEVISTWEDKLKDKSYKGTLSNIVNLENLEQTISKTQDLLNNYEQNLVDGAKAKDEAEYSLAEDKERKLRKQIESLVSELKKKKGSCKEYLKSEIQSIENDWKEMSKSDGRLQKLLLKASKRFNDVDEETIYDVLNNGIYVITDGNSYLTGYSGKNNGNPYESGKLSEALWSSDKQIMENYLNQIGLSGKAGVIKVTYKPRAPKYNQELETLVEKVEELTQEDLDKNSFGNSSGNYVSGSNGFGSDNSGSGFGNNGSGFDNNSGKFNATWINLG